MEQKVLNMVPAVLSYSKLSVGLSLHQNTNDKIMENISFKQIKLYLCASVTKKLTVVGRQ